MKRQVIVWSAPDTETDFVDQRLYQIFAQKSQKIILESKNICHTCLCSMYL